MKKTTLILLILVLVSATFAQKLNVLMDYKSYFTTQGEPYLEISCFVKGKTVVYRANEQGKYQAEVRITLQAFQSDSLINKLDYILMSELFDNDSASTKPDFGDIQNLQLPNGEYLLQFSATDMNTNVGPIYYTDVVEMNYPETEVSISDISLYQSISRDLQEDIFGKYGLSLKPLFYGFVPESMYTLPFSCEIYNTDKMVGEEIITVKSYITCFENNFMPYNEARFNTKTTAKPIIITLGEIGIYKLPSGNYNLIVEVYSKDSLLLAKNSCFFQRSNPNIQLELSELSVDNIENTFVEQMVDTTKLLEYVRYLFPISTPIEKDFYTWRMNKISIENLKKFFYNFWLKRDPENPQRAWNEYLEKVKWVNREFGCKLVQGYRTDRGRVYLQYGPPNSIYESPYDSHSYPYEIWHYYYCVDQSNVKFVFYNTDLVSNDYQLLHSNRRGEIQDPFWQLILTNRKTPIFNPDLRTPEDYFGGNPKYDWFDNK